MRLLLILSILATPALGQAQSDAPIRLATGFTPDPAHARGRTVGTIALRTRAPSCRGFVGTEPDHRLELRSAFGFFRMFLVAGQELTLAVRGPDGGWRCSTAHGETPALHEGPFAAGNYEIWVGSLSHGSHVEYELSLTEFRSVGPSVEGAAGRSGGIDVGLDAHAETGRFRDRRIRRGFLPDPIRDAAQAGGDVDARLLGADCRGFVGAAPNHLMTLRDEFDYLRIQLGGNVGETTLVLRTPGGRYLCSSPEEANAFVDQDAWSPGIYMIWVGSRREQTSPDYAICYTEARLGEGSATCSASEDDEP